ncbi:MAG: hypothetical protein R3A44_26470 [Caldilineaceae bacterium]
MEWTNPFEEMSKSWAQTQQKMWNNWAETAQTMGQKQTGAAWRSMIDAWQMSMNQLLDAQTEGVRLWADTAEALPNTPQGAHEWMLMCSDMTQHWTDTQKQLWNNWFALIKELNPEKFGASMDAPSVSGDPMLKFWQDAAQTMNSAQQEWNKAWNAMAAGAQR